MSALDPKELAQRLGRRAGCCALVAIKERARCKSRLGGVLADQERIALVRAMLAGVIAAARGAHCMRQVIVVSPERDTVPADVPVLADTGAGLNAALTQAHRALLDLGCSEVLVLPADLPLVSAAEIDALVRAARDGGFAMSSDDAGVGTNALALVGGVPFHFQFGADSRRLHLAEAARLALAPQLLRLPGLEFDVDSPADLQRLVALQCRTRLQA